MVYSRHLFIHLIHIFCRVLIFYSPFRHSGPLLTRGGFPFCIWMTYFVNGDVIFHPELKFPKRLKSLSHSREAEWKPKAERHGAPANGCQATNGHFSSFFLSARRSRGENLEEESLYLPSKSPLSFCPSRLTAEYIPVKSDFKTLSVQVARLFCLLLCSSAPSHLPACIECDVTPSEDH